MVGTFNDEGEISFKAGKWTYWYENGQKWREEIYSSERFYTKRKEGVEIGIWTYWEKDGNMYKGKVIGKREFIKNTKPRTVNKRKPIEEDGSFLFFDYTRNERTTNIKSFESWNSGKKDGEWMYFNDGIKTHGGTYKDGKKDGLLTFWYENGRKRAEQTYKEGEEISEKCWDKDGNEEECD